MNANKKNKMKKLFVLDPEKNLTNQWPFRLINGFLFLISFSISMIILYKGDYSADWSPVGFRTFLYDFGFPISIAALIIPASALIATMHRSSQLSTQINLLTQQNNFANYYKHLDEFKRYLRDTISKEDICVIENNVLNVYGKFYPNTRKGSYHFNTSLGETFITLIKTHYEEFEELKFRGGNIWDFIDYSINVQLVLKKLTNIDFELLNKEHFKKYEVRLDVEGAIQMIFDRLRAEVILIIKVASFEKYQDQIYTTSKLYDYEYMPLEDLSQISFN
jgi:hypothetical protein